MRTRLLAIALVVLLAAGLGTLVLRGGGGEEARAPLGDADRRLAPARGESERVADPLAYDPEEREAFEARAAAGLSHVLYAKSPGGAIATAARVARWRELVEAAVADTDVVSADELEAIVFLESAGRPDAMAGGTEGAVGLTQILAQTGRDLLGMRVDEALSARLTRGIRRGRAVARREARRREVDERYDPAEALAATVRYLEFAEGELGREDLAIVSYHMGVGNLQNALAAFGADEPIAYARLFFDSTPLRHARAWSVLASLGDDSSTYLWRVRAAQEIMRLSREDPGELTALDARALRATAGLRLDADIGELVPLGRRAPYRALRPEALAVLRVIGTGTREISGDAPLTVTSTVRDRRYQRLLLRDGNPEATRGYSLHTTGFAFDIARRYRSRAQAQAFQFLLDRLQALDLIAWVREPGAIHVTVGPRAAELLPG